MTTYRVALVGKLRELWTIDATTPTEAEERVVAGEGRFIESEWIDIAQANAEPTGETAPR